jgi:hypothetical protein
VKLFCPEIFGRENFKARNFSGNTIFYRQKILCQRKMPRRKRIDFGSLIITIGLENFRAENFFMPDFFGFKNFKVRFFWMRNYFVQKFLGHKDCAGRKKGSSDVLSAAFSY